MTPLKDSDEFGSTEAPLDAGTKELLSFCWRALKEARYDIHLSRRLGIAKNWL